MPLGIPNGIPIAPKAETPEAVPSGEITLDAAPNVTTGSKVLPIDPVTQDQDQWCWAACVQMVSTFFERGKNQCEVVGLKKGLPNPQDCCGPQEKDFGEEGCHPDEMVVVWKKCDIKAVPLVATDLDQPRQLKFADIKAQIDNDHPVAVGIKWNDEEGGGGHAVIIKGWERSNRSKLVWVNDPLPQTKLHLTGTQGKILLEELQTANLFGLWLHTWKDIGVVDHV
jgi:hypothetical protein